MVNLSKRRVASRRAIAWSGCIALSIVAAVEIRARWGYSSTVSDLRQVASNAAGGQTLQLSEVRRFFHAAPYQRELNGGPATVLELHWFSFVREYAICLSVTGTGELAALNTGAFSKKRFPSTSPDADASVTDLAASALDHDQLTRERVAAELETARENSDAERAFADIVLPESHEFDPEAVALVKSMYEENPKRALPAERDAATPNAAIAEGEWLRQQYVEIYEEFGSKDAKWDKAAIAFLGEAGAALAEQKMPADQVARLAEPGAELMQSGCDDPLVGFVVGALYARFNDEKGVVFRNQAFERFRDGRYPLDCVLRVTLPYARRQAWNRLVYSYRKRSAGVDEHGIYGANPIHPARRFLLLECLRCVTWTSYTNAREFLGAVYCVPQFDPWLKAMLTGRYFSALGAGVDLQSNNLSGSEINEPAWPLPPEFEGVRYRHSWSAQAYYLDAWKADPSIPEAAYGILTEVGVEAWRRRKRENSAWKPGQPTPPAPIYGTNLGWPKADGRDATRFWFDQSIQAQFDFMPAYEQVLSRLSHLLEPGDNRGPMLRFGRECLNTNRFDTPVPQVFLDGLNNFSSPANYQVYGLPGVYDDCCRTIAGYSQVAQSDHERNRLKSLAACLAIRARKTYDARRILNELGDAADLSVFETQKVDLLTIRKLLNQKHANYRLLPDLDRPVSGIAFAGNDDTLLTAEGDVRTTTRWNLKESVSTGLFAHETEVAALVAASADGKLVATTGTGGAVYIWDAASGAMLRTLAHDSQVRIMRFSLQGTQLATSARDEPITSGTVRVWDLSTGEILARRTIPDSYFHDIAFVAGENTLAIAGNCFLAHNNGGPGEISLWNLATDQTTKTFHNIFKKRQMTGFALAANGKHLAAKGFCLTTTESGRANFHDEIRIVDLEQDGDLDLVEAGHNLVFDNYGVSSLSYIGQGEILATAGPDRVVRVWRVPEFRLVAEFTGHRERLRALAVAPEASRLASLDQGGHVNIWELSGAATASQAHGELLEFPFETVVR
ncbi:MAG TPA: hypothetical protein VKU82_05675, partial [Planctomycetaceae bacterium]|nr:hypothetical protein [Planctomycetaceae bacterium]